MERFILYVESDDHGGNTRGLLNPDTVLYKDEINILATDDDGKQVFEIVQKPYHPGLRPWQEYLWEIIRKPNLKKLVELANGDPIVYLHTGDMSQGQKYVSDWVSTRIGDQFEIAYWNQKPIMDLPNLRAVRYVEGTSSHVFGDGTTEEVVTNRLKAEYPNIDIAASVHGLVDVKLGGSSYIVDYSHHGPGPGSRSWLKANVATYYLRDHMIRELMECNEPPHLYLRAHYHEWIKAMWNISARGKDFTSYLCLMPSLSGAGAYARQATKSLTHVTNGSIAFEVVGNKLIDVHRWTRTVDIRLREVIE